MPPEMVIMARALRVFGHLSETVFELVPRMVPRVLAPHEALFNIGDTDDSLYIVVSGEWVHILGWEARQSLRFPSPHSPSSLKPRKAR